MYTVDESNPIEYRNSKNDPYVYLKIISNKIEEIKRHRLTKEQYFKIIEKHPALLPAKYTLLEQLEEEATDAETELQEEQTTLEAQLEAVRAEFDAVKEQISADIESSTPSFS